MKKVLKIVLLTPLLLLVLALIILSIKYTPTYVYRLITMNVADVYDYKHFENRTIHGADSGFQFARNLDESYVESLFMDRVRSSGFQTFDDWAIQSKTTALIFIRRDTIIYEKYFNGFAADSYFHSQSMAKSFISFLIGAAIDDGYIHSIDDKMTQYIPELEERNPNFAKISIQNLLEMRSGLKYYEGYFPGTHIHLPWHDEAVGYYHPKVRKLLLEKVGIADEPGKKFQYCNYNTSYLGLIIERATNKTVSEYLEARLWSKIMARNALFSIDSKKSGFEYIPSRLIARAMDFARFGRLYLHQGNWNGHQIISKNWVFASTKEDTSISRKYYPEWLGNDCNHTYYSYQWWGNSQCDSTYQFFANGNLGQIIYVIPREDIIVVHLGNSNALFNASDLQRVADNVKYHEFHESLLQNGVANTIQNYREKKKQQPACQPFDAHFLMRKGYAYLDGGYVEEAKQLFALNMELHPDTWFVYNNMAEAYSKSGAKDTVIRLYQKSLAMRPENNWAMEKLKLLE